MGTRTAILLAHHSGYLIQFRGALIRQLRERGFRVVVATPIAAPQVLEQLSAVGAECVPLALSRTGLNPIHDLKYARSVQGLIAQQSPSILIATGIKPILYGLPLSRAADVAVRVAFFAGLGVVIRPSSFGQRIIGLLAAPMVRRALLASTHVVTQNSDDSLELSKRFGRCMARAPITTPGSGVDLSYFRPAPGSSRTDVLMISRVTPEKGVWEFITAARMVRSEYPNVEFSFAGFFESSARGTPRSRFLTACRDAGVNYLGHVDDVRPIIGDCSMVVLPSYSEGRPRALQEALAMGKPVVTTNVPGCRDCIIDGVHGRIVPPRDGRALAAAIIELLPNAEDPRMATACRLYAEERYCATSIASNLLDSVIGPDFRSGSVAELQPTDHSARAADSGVLHGRTSG
jgi:hypothetical protein